MKIGTMVPCVHSLDANRAAVAGLTQLGLDSLWLPDHLMGFVHPGLWSGFPASSGLPDPDAFLDPFCLAAALGESTSLPLGTCVTDATRRRGPDLARAAMTLNDICGGGFILGVGAGEAESTSTFGYDWSRPVGNLDRALREIRSLLDAGTMPDGSIGRTGLDRQGPKGVPEVWVAAHGPRSLRLAGRYGDGWLSVVDDPTVYAEMLGQVHAAADEAGRPRPIAAMFPVTIFGESGAAVRELLETSPLLKLVALWADGELWTRFGIEHPNGPDSHGHHFVPHAFDPGELAALAERIPVELVEKWMLIGSGAEVAARLEPFIEAGLEYVVIADFTGIAQPPEALEAAVGQMAVLAETLRAG